LVTQVGFTLTLTTSITGIVSSGASPRHGFQPPREIRLSLMLSAAIFDLTLVRAAHTRRHAAIEHSTSAPNAR
jgi:hypothetical protein